jgi:hypothetical protein
MKKILIPAFLMAFCFSGAGASEYLGTISTDPDSLSPVSADPADDDIAGQDPSAEAGGDSGNNGPEERTDDGFVRQPPAAAILPFKPVSVRKDTGEEAQTGADSEEKNNPPFPASGKVLGIKAFRNHELLRAADGKIYVIEGEVKKHIIDLEELKKYGGLAVHAATAGELSRYKDRNYLDSCLIRQKGDPKVYVIEGGRKRHIRSIEELRARYFGREIYNIGGEEMGLY